MVGTCTSTALLLVLALLGNIPDAAVALPLRVSQEVKVAVLSVLAKSSAVVTHNERLPDGGRTTFRDNDDGKKKDSGSDCSSSSLSSSGKNTSRTANLSLQLDAVEIVRSLVNILESNFELETWKSRRVVVIVETTLL